MNLQWRRMRSKSRAESESFIIEYLSFGALFPRVLKVICCSNYTALDIAGLLNKPGSTFNTPLCMQSHDLWPAGSSVCGSTE